MDRKSQIEEQNLFVRGTWFSPKFFSGRADQDSTSEHFDTEQMFLKFILMDPNPLYLIGFRSSCLQVYSTNSSKEECTPIWQKQLATYIRFNASRNTLHYTLRHSWPKFRRLNSNEIYQLILFCSM